MSQAVVQESCLVCDGQGSVESGSCRYCQGSGVIRAGESPLAAPAAGIEKRSVLMATGDCRVPAKLKTLKKAVKA